LSLAAASVGLTARARWRAIRLLLAVIVASPGVFSLACAQAALPPGPAIAAASVRWLCTGVFGCRKFQGGRFVVDPAFFSCDLCDALRAVEFAYGITIQSQIEGNPDWMSWDQYQIRIASASPIHQTKQARALLRRVLAQCFSLRVRRVAKSVPGYALVVAPGGVKFHASATRPPFRVADGIEQLPSLQRLASVLSQYYYDGRLFGVTRPVRDATGLRGFYLIPFPASPEPGTNLLAVVGRLGLRVKPVRGTESTLRILHIGHPVGACSLGPEPAQVGH
jgi:uncharacterized protein (TIGR03435 family)